MWLLLVKLMQGNPLFLTWSPEENLPVASYPYTTLIPYEGEIKTMPGTFLLDIPGLEKKASLNEKKGLCFLRACGRARILLHFLSSDSETLREDKKELDQELKDFDRLHYDNYFEKLSKKPMFYIFSKSEDLKKSEKENLVKKIKTKEKTFFLSNKTGEGVKEILKAVKKS